MNEKSLIKEEVVVDGQYAGEVTDGAIRLFKVISRSCAGAHQYVDEDGNNTRLSTPSGQNDLPTTLYFNDGSVKYICPSVRGEICGKSANTRQTRVTKCPFNATFGA